MPNEHPDRPHGHDDLVKITVNTKWKVDIAGPTASGLEIKEAAIAQGVPIELDFQLRMILHDHESKVVGDADIVEIDKHSKFLANAPDDNS